MGNKKILEVIVGNLLKNKGYRLAIAESCTGGLISNRITNVPGSSQWFDRGYITYSNRSKTEELLVPAALINKYGAVSKEAALAMAKAARRKSGADIAVAVTGIAGPTGATREKLIGTLHIAIDGHDGSRHRELYLKGDRLLFKEQAANGALDMLKEYLAEES